MAIVFMPKLPVVTPRKMIRALTRLGFNVYSKKGRGGHIMLAHPDGRKTIVPMHSKDIPTGTLLAILKDIKISKEEFVEMLSN